MNGMTPTQDTAALADRIKRHLRLTSLGLDTRALLEGALAALRAPPKPDHGDAAALADEIAAADFLVIRNCPMVTKFDHENVDKILSGEQHNLIVAALRAPIQPVGAVPFGYLIEKSGINNGYYFVSLSDYENVEERFKYLYKPIYDSPPSQPAKLGDDDAR